MYETLQILHVILFGALCFFRAADKQALLYLCGSGVFYLAADVFLWDYFKPWPLGIYFYIVMACFDFFIITRLYKNLTYFVGMQCIILWVLVGVHLLTALEFPFLYDIHFMRDIYTDATNILNICQLIVGVIYGLYLNNLGDFLHTRYCGMVSGRVVNIRSKEK